jgi:hypothetical protein
MLFRTIDGASQATIATQYADGGLFIQAFSFRYGGYRRLRFSFFKKTKNRTTGLTEWARSSVG